MANLAVIKLGGSEFIVRPGDKFEVNKLSQEVDGTFKPEVILSTDKEDVLLGQGTVEARVLKEKRGDKLFVIRFKAKSRYRRRTGHRQYLSVVEVLSVNGEKPAAKSAAKKEEVSVETAEVVAKPKRTTKKAVKKTEE